MTKYEFVGSCWRKASEEKGVRQRDLCRKRSTQAGANIKEAKKTIFFWR